MSSRFPGKKFQKLVSSGKSASLEAPGNFLQPWLDLKLGKNIPLDEFNEPSKFEGPFSFGSKVMTESILRY